jgi:two-component system alkaline phosphatase synthesis response regulator PhoP
MNQGENKKVLIVEDELPLSRALSLKVEKTFGAVPVCVYDGDQAIRVLGEQQFDIILLDLVIPAKNGFEVLEYMKQQGITTPVIVASNLNQQSDIDRVKSFGIRDFFLKSTSPITSILDAMKTYLN